MKQRKRIPGKQSRKLFRNTADKTHMFNIKAKPMRGGIRM